jgi:hypothetical protein
MRSSTPPAALFALLVCAATVVGQTPRPDDTGPVITQVYTHAIWKTYQYEGAWGWMYHGNYTSLADAQAESAILTAMRYPLVDCGGMATKRAHTICAINVCPDNGGPLGATCPSTPPVMVPFIIPSRCPPVVVCPPVVCQPACPPKCERPRLFARLRCR